MNCNRATGLVVINVNGHAYHSERDTCGTERQLLLLFPWCKAQNKSILELANRHAKITFMRGHVGLAISDTKMDARAVGRDAPTEPKSSENIRAAIKMSTETILPEVHQFAHLNVKLLIVMLGQNTVSKVLRLHGIKETNSGHDRRFTIKMMPIVLQKNIDCSNKFFGGIGNIAVKPQIGKLIGEMLQKWVTKIVQNVIRFGRETNIRQVKSGDVVQICKTQAVGLPTDCF